MSAAAAASRSAVESPCVRVCMVDGRLGLCLGCRRTLPEITRWGAMTPNERAEIMAALPSRPQPSLPGA